MKPSIAVDITARDKTEAGQKAAERRLGGFAKRSGAMAKESGLGKFGKQLDGLTKFKRLSFGFDDAGRSISSIGQMSVGASQNVGALTSHVLGLGGAAKGAFGEIAEVAGVATGAIAGTVAAVAGLGIATYMLGEKWGKQGAEIGRTSRNLAVSSGKLQQARAANERFGVSVDQTDAALDGLGTTLYDARYGANNLALGAMNQLGVKMKHTKDGAIDVAAAYDDITDAIARQKDPLVQRKVAAIFGMSGILPAIRQGSTKLNAEGADYAGSGAQLSDSEVAEATEVQRKTVTVRQHLSAIEKTVGVAAMGATNVGADAILGKPGTASRAITGIKGTATELVQGGRQAAHELVEGGRQAAHEIVEAIRNTPRSMRDRASEAAAYFRKLGYSPDQARGMTAGAYAESQLDPTSVNPTSGAFGIGQWLGGRKKELLRRYGAHPSFGQQLEFMGWELTHTENPAGQVIRSAGSATDAMEAYIQRFMRPAQGDETSGDLRRGGSFLGAEAPGSGRGGPASEPTAKAHVEIVLKGAPPGTVTKVTPTRGLDVGVRVARSLDGP